MTFMAGPFALDYFVFILIATLGALQAVAAYKGLMGLLFIRVRSVAFLGGLIATALAFLWFFISEPRNLPDTGGGLDGNQMGGIFALAAGSGVIFTFLVSSIINRAMSNGESHPHHGLDAMRETTYIKALVSTVKSLLWARSQR